MSLFSKPPHFFTRLTRFEFWPFWFFYIPMYFYGLWLAFRARSLMYFSTTNPGMKYSGVMGESKYKILRSIPQNYIPLTILIEPPFDVGDFIKTLEKKPISFPFVVKPDVGERGKEVEIIHKRGELENYLFGKSYNVIAQELVADGIELGVLYHRQPDSPKGMVTSVVRKGFLTVTGDGKSSLAQLIEADIRASDRRDYLLKKFEKTANCVVPAGEKMNLEPIGNHCRGTTFFNANELINDALNEVFNKISLEIEGFYYGRFDLKVPSLSDLYAGRNIKIFELNGVSSEVAHVYDPDYKLLRAYRDIARHMKYIYVIARKNHALGFRYDSLSAFLSDLHRHLKNRQN